MANTFELRTDIVTRKRKDQTEEAVKEQALRMGLNALSNATAYSKDYSHYIFDKGIPSRWSRSSILDCTRIFTVVVVVNTDPAPEIIERENEKKAHDNA